MSDPFDQVLTLDPAAPGSAVASAAEPAAGDPFAQVMPLDGTSNIEHRTSNIEGQPEDRPGITLPAGAVQPDAVGPVSAGAVAPWLQPQPYVLPAAANRGQRTEDGRRQTDSVPAPTATERAAVEQGVMKQPAAEPVQPVNTMTPAYKDFVKAVVEGYGGALRDIHAQTRKPFLGAPGTEGGLPMIPAGDRMLPKGWDKTDEFLNNVGNFGPGLLNFMTSAEGIATAGSGGIPQLAKYVPFAMAAQMSYEGAKDVQDGINNWAKLDGPARTALLTQLGLNALMMGSLVAHSAFPAKAVAANKARLDALSTAEIGKQKFHAEHCPRAFSR